MNLEALIDNIPDFPQKGVMFKDFSPLLQKNFPEVLEELSAKVDWSEIDVIAGIESRGFILASGLAAKHGKGFVMVRKKGKLPPPTVEESYALEYGTDSIEMKINKENLKVLVVDDVLATGGTLRATLNLCEKANYTVVDSLVLIDLKFLNKLEDEGIKVKSVWQYS